MLTAANTASATTFKSLHDFHPYTEGGFAFYGLTPGTDGAFYGITTTGGDFGNGTIFKVTPTGSFKVLHSFLPAEGYPESATLFQTTAGKLYGLTTANGPDAPAILYSIASNGVFQKLHTFGAADGYLSPIGKQVCINDDIYGMSSNGSQTILYRMSLSGAITVLHTLNLVTEGISSQGLTYGPDGAFYSICNSYLGGGGTILRFTTTGDTTVLHTFGFNELAGWPSPLAVGPDGNLWGTFDASGSGNSRSIYKITPAGTFTVVAADLSGIGSIIYGPLTAKGDSLYGEMMQSSSGFGKVFKITTQGTVSVVYSFDGQPSCGPIGGLVVGKDGGLYGTATYLPSSMPGALGGAASTIFKVTDTGVFTLVHALTVADGSAAAPGLVATADDTLYGVTEDGGKYEQGMLYKISSTGVITDIYDFNSVEGNPFNLIQGPDGNLYGLTSHTIFKAVPGQKPTTFYRFTSPETPYGQLTVGSNHWMYGVTLTGGQSGFGGVYRFNTLGQFVPFGSFPTLIAAEQVTLAANGNVYGTTPYGTTWTSGAIFKVTKAGEFSYAYSFPDGAWPTQGLTAGKDGKLYGITGANKRGIFAFNPATSQATSVHSFNTDTDYVTGTSLLTPGADGTLYGTVANLASVNHGASALYSFNPASGQFNTLSTLPTYVPGASFYIDLTMSLTFSPSGKLYGSSAFGGAYQNGQIFTFE